MLLMASVRTSTAAICKAFLKLVGGWATPLKNMKVNWDDEIPNIWENKIDVPNHQPVSNPQFISASDRLSTSVLAIPPIPTARDDGENTAQVIDFFSDPEKMVCLQCSNHLKKGASNNDQPPLMFDGFFGTYCFFWGVVFVFALTT